MENGVGQMKIKESCAVGLFAFLGGISRYLIGLGFNASGGFPYGTLAVNLIGAFCLPFLIRYIIGHYHLNDQLALAIGTGFFGAFTTFSSFSVDALRLLQSHQLAAFGWYLGISLIGGVACSLLADYWAVKLLAKHGEVQVVK
ncbi:hypothetical protein FC69_GL001880 [Latilactobacillus fuchuensis DSM 14340 = JCM 11249]|uniref:Fluoride-specific ion channel FluC n=2 Tax=Latilactobacillus fuchuensis TaxID=164393 RepID=A0A0R1RPG7_9LACO|nr:hypothetical protein FC69_GL001880 [Latilactobacillus fuchuensis DSM 14340 = JCM 11249]